MKFAVDLHAVALKENASNAVIDMMDGTTGLLSHFTVAIYAGDDPRALAVVANTTFSALTKGATPDAFVDLSNVHYVAPQTGLSGGAVTSGVKTKQSRSQAVAEASNAKNKVEDESVVGAQDSSGDTGTEFD